MKIKIPDFAFQLHFFYFFKKMSNLLDIISEMSLELEKNI